LIATSAVSSTGNPGATPAVVVERLRKVYGENVAVREVSFTVMEGEVLGIIGPNGAGKTTTVECISALRTPDAGSIRVFGMDPQRHRPDIRKAVGVQLQESGVPPSLRVEEAVELFASFYPSPANVPDLLNALGLSEKRRELYRRLSGGQKQRVSIALALVGNPRLAILDELTTGLDPQARRETWKFIEEIRSRGVTVILVTHFMDEVERLCDRVVLIDRGRVVATGTPAELAARAGGGTYMRFLPSGPVDERRLSDLPGVTGVAREGIHLVVTGGPDVASVVVRFLDSVGLQATDIQVRAGNLDDAFVRLTTSSQRPGPGKVPDP
jgi:ABC-2 type transport system ATP-binding protein